MRSPLRTQIFWPIAGLLTLSAVLLTGTSTWYAARNSELQTRRHMQAVTDALGNASYPLTPDVVRRMGAMIGGELLFVDREGQLTASTTDEFESLWAQLRDLPITEHGPASQIIRWNSSAYLVAAIDRVYVARPGTLYVLLPNEDFAVLWRNALLPPLAVILPILALALGLALVISRRVGHRVDQLRELFNRLASGDFQPVQVSGRDDELRDLMVSANQLSEQLRAMQEHLIVSERLQLLGQLSGGLAHQLRNSITGARLAVQLHARSCSEPDNMIDTAVSQLNLTEEQILAVTSLRPESDELPSLQDADLSQITRNVAALLQPLCSHWNSQLSLELPHELPARLHSPRSVKGALLNLVQNAVESAGIDGQVCVSVTASDEQAVIRVSDSGPGFPEGGGRLKEAFRTTKPEGMGLGLTIAQHSVDQEQGQLIIDRIDEQTVVELQLPLHTTPELSRSRS